METCTEEVGLLKKKPCGKPMVAHCATCEQPLCSAHAVAQVTPAGKKTGKFMCKPHYAAWLQYEQTKVEPAPPPKAAAPAPGAKPAEAKPAEAKPAAAGSKPAAAKPAEEPKKENPDGSIDFTPSKK
jgi:hypothetical protein